MNNAPAIRETSVAAFEFDDKKISLLRDTICKGANKEELELFLHACQRTGLDPFMKQIYPVKRWDSNLKREAMTIQTGIDGYRLIAERTGKYCPGSKTEYEYEPNGNLISATAYVKKQTSDGIWHEISATAFYDEYCQKTKEGKPTSMWAKMGRTMLAKCAEALALRKCFPADLSGLYTHEEMQQAGVTIECQSALHEPKELIDPEDLKALEMAIGGDQEYIDRILGHYKISCLDELEKKHFSAVYGRAMAYLSKKKIEAQPAVLLEPSVFETQ